MLSRYDLSIALLHGSSPVFYCAPETVIQYPGELTAAPNNEVHSQNNNGLIRQLDDNLAAAYQAVRRFCLMVNLRLPVKQIINLVIIHETMTSVMYRLLYTSFAAESINKALQLGLLAFSYHLFIQWQDIKLPNRHFLKIYQECIQSLEIMNSVSPHLMLWLLMTGAISLFDITNEAWPRECLLEYINRCQVKTWKEVQDTLESFIWISVLDGQLGEQIYNKL